MFPAVAEVVLVSSDDTRPGKVRGDWDFPAGQDQFIALQGVVIRDALLPFTVTSASGATIFKGTLQDRVVRENQAGTLDFYETIKAKAQ